MKDDKRKKMQAALAGVMYHLQEESEMRPNTRQDNHPDRPSNWALYSRQLIMINRDRFQRRVVKR